MVKSGRLNSDPKKIRYGCCVPALTGLAKNLSKAAFQGLYGEEKPRLQGAIINAPLFPH